MAKAGHGKKSRRKKVIAEGMASTDSPVLSNDEGLFSKPWKSSDLVLIVEDRKFHVHRAVLIICSPVFETMLSGNFKEKHAREIPLPDKKADEFEQLLQGIYPDRDLWITKENCLFLLKLSTEYQIERLKDRCEEFVRHWCQNDMTTEECIEVVILSQKYPLNECTVEGCLKKFAKRMDLAWQEIKQHKCYSELEPANVQRLTEVRMKHFENYLSHPGSEAYKEEQRFQRLQEEELLRAEKRLQQVRCFRV